MTEKNAAPMLLDLKTNPLRFIGYVERNVLTKASKMEPGSEFVRFYANLPSAADWQLMALAILSQPGIGGPLLPENLQKLVGEYLKQFLEKQQAALGKAGDN